MGWGGAVWILGILAGLGWLYASRRKAVPLAVPTDSLLALGARVVLERAPMEMTDGLTPPWQKEFGKKLAVEGHSFIGDYSYSSSTFFWARTFITPDRKSALALVNWVEGKGGFKQVVTNLEIYSFLEDGSFIVTAQCQDGAARLLTGASRPPEDRLDLKLQAVFSEIDARPQMEKHRQRLAEWEAKGHILTLLEPKTVIPVLSRIFSL